MGMIYVDTSAIVAALDSQDPRQNRAKELLEKTENKIVSEIVLAELASVISRRWRFVKDIAERLGLSRDEASVAILIYILKRFGLKYRLVDGSTRLPLLGKVYRPVAVAIELSSKARLKTLDLLHVAYAKLMKEEGESIEEILTADTDFEKAGELLKKLGLELRVLK